MYAQLGEIRFENLIGFSSHEDTKSTNYAEHALIENKPRLQRVGENLQEIKLSMYFHSFFCNPKTEYDNLNNYRVGGTSLPLIYGNGDAEENEFVIISITKSTEEAFPDGTIMAMRVEVELKENYVADIAVLQANRSKAKAFAVNGNRPLPFNLTQSYQNPINTASVELAAAKKEQAQLDALTTKSTKKADALNPIIEKAQAFRDSLQVLQAKLADKIDKIDQKLLSLNNVLNVFTSLQIIAPNLQDEIVFARAATLTSRNLISGYVSLPGIVNNTTDAALIIGVMGDTKQAQQGLNDAMKRLNTAGQPLATAIATKKVI